LGQTQILKTVAVREVGRNAVSGSMYLTAMAVAGIEYFGTSSENHGSGHRGLADAAVEDNSYAYESIVVVGDESHSDFTVSCWLPVRI
jgi:hypothetical protein